MDKEEMKQWAALLNAQADGKQLEYKPLPEFNPNGIWLPAKIVASTMAEPERWRVVLIPPKPPQEWLDNERVEIVAGPMSTLEAKAQYPEDRVAWLRQSDGVWVATASEAKWCFTAGHASSAYIIRPRAARVKPWTLDTVPVPLVVKRKSDNTLFTIITAAEYGVTTTKKFSTNPPLGMMHPASIVSHSWEMLLENYTQRDGSPCGEIAK